jgi:4a-hydroxytetrahydrobiopterin dehydratase
VAGAARGRTRRGSFVRYAGSLPRLAGWKLAQNKLSRTFEFQGFVQPLSFVNSLVAYFETIDHHPDVYIAYGEVTFELTRYDVGGKVTDRDVKWRRRFRRCIERGPDRFQMVEHRRVAFGGVWTPGFRWGQHAVIDTVLAGTHTLAIMPTGQIVQWKER